MRRLLFVAPACPSRRPPREAAPAIARQTRGFPRRTAPPTAESCMSLTGKSAAQGGTSTYMEGVFVSKGCQVFGRSRIAPGHFNIKQSRLRLGLGSAGVPPAILLLESRCKTAGGTPALPMHPAVPHQKVIPTLLFRSAL